MNEYLVVLMLGFFGLKVTLLYAACGLSIGILYGLALGKMGLERYIHVDFRPKCCCKGGGTAATPIQYESLKKRALFGVDEALSIIAKLWKWILIGVGVGALIHNYVPREGIDYLVELTGVFAVPLVVILGIPMYGSCASILPIAVALFTKGVPLGTALAFLMATSALSLPEAILLKRAMNAKMISVFFATTGFSIAAIGYLLNYIDYIFR